MKEQDIYFVRSTTASIQQDLAELQKRIIDSPDFDATERIRLIGRLHDIGHKLDLVEEQLTRVKRQAPTRCLPKVEQSSTS